MRHSVRNLKWTLLNVLKQLALGGIEIGRNADKHLIDQDTQQVPVNAARVARAPEHLRGKVGDRSTERLRDVLRANSSLRQAEISEHRVAVSVKYDVVRLQISEDDILLV